MIEAGRIGITAVFDDSEARAKAQKYVQDMRALMASVNPSGPGGGFFNRTAGAGNLGPGGAPIISTAAATPRFASLDAESAALRSGMLALTRAMFTQANTLNTMTGAIRNQLGPVAPAGGAGAAIQGAGSDAAGSSSLLAGFGRRFAAMFAIHAITGAIGAGQTQGVMNASLDRKLALGDFGGAVDEQLSQAKSMREGFGGWARERLNPIWKFFGSDRFDDSAHQERLENSQMLLRGSSAQESAREQIRQMRQHNELLGLGSYAASRVQARHAIDDAAHNAQPLKSLANLLTTLSPTLAKSLLGEAGEIEGQGNESASRIKAAADRNASTIGMTLRYGIDVQREENRLHPGQAHALEIFAHASEQIRSMLINSSPENAELARRLGIEQLTGDRIQTIMSGRGSSFDPTAELVGPQVGSGSEQVADILKRIEDLLQELTSESLGDLGETDNPN